MLVACLWSHWTDPPGKEPDLLSSAAITDDPEPEVAAAGHDRTIINIKPEHVDAWLNSGALEQRRAGTDPERFRQVTAAFAGSATVGRILPAMRSSHGFRTAPIPSSWVQTGERWALWYNGRETASVTPDCGPGVRLWMEGKKFRDVKEVRAANVRQAKRYGERWCAARLYPDLRLREAVARLTDSMPIQLPPPLPGLPPTREQQQQALRLAEAGAKEVARIKVAPEPRRPLREIKPRAKDRMKVWVRAGSAKRSGHPQGV